MSDSMGGKIPKNNDLIVFFYTGSFGCIYNFLLCQYNSYKILISGNPFMDIWPKPVDLGVIQFSS